MEIVNVLPSTWHPQAAGSLAPMPVTDPSGPGVLLPPSPATSDWLLQAETPIKTNVASKPTGEERKQSLSMIRMLP
jgi:hypothetical protein